MREHDASGLTASELERTRRELATSLTLARPGSHIRAPIEAHITAIDAELAERDLSRYQEPAIVVVDRSKTTRPWSVT